MDYLKYRTIAEKLLKSEHSSISDLRYLLRVMDDIALRPNLEIGFLAAFFNFMSHRRHLFDNEQAENISVYSKCYYRFFAKPITAEELMQMFWEDCLKNKFRNSTDCITWEPIKLAGSYVSSDGFVFSLSSLKKLVPLKNPYTNNSFSKEDEIFILASLEIAEMGIKRQNGSFRISTLSPLFKDPVSDPSNKMNIAAIVLTAIQAFMPMSFLTWLLIDIGFTLGAIFYMRHLSSGRSVNEKIMLEKIVYLLGFLTYLPIVEYYISLDVFSDIKKIIPLEGVHVPFIALAFFLFKDKLLNKMIFRLNGNFEDLPVIFRNERQLFP